MDSPLPGLGITGSTGAVGGMVARQLASAGVAQRLLVREPSRAPSLPGSAVEQVSYGDPESARRALQGVRTLFMVSAGESEERLQEHGVFVDAAAASAVQHLVYLSFYGAAPDAVFTLARDHHYTEERIRSSGMRWTFLRDNLYLDLLPRFAGEDGVLRGPAGAGRFAGVARADVARAVVAVLGDVDASAGATYDLTGPHSLSLDEAATVMTQCLGRRYRFHNETVEEAYASRASYAAPQWQLDAWVSTYTAIAAGHLDGVTDHVERLTGRPPLSLADVLGDGTARSAGTSGAGRADR